MMFSPTVVYGAASERQELGDPLVGVWGDIPTFVMVSDLASVVSSVPGAVLREAHWEGPGFSPAIPPSSLFCFLSE